MKEEITDLISEKGMANLKVGKILIFDRATIKVTRIDRKNKRIWGEHISLVDQTIVRTHYGHKVDATQKPPFCTDCELTVDQASTEDGDKKALDRIDNTLSDGTIIEGENDA